MVFQLCGNFMNANVQAANKGYDIVLTQVGYFYKDGAGKLFCDYRTLGNSAVGENFTMKFYVDGQNKGEVTATSIGLTKGITRRAEVTLNGNYSGRHRITAVADINDDRKSNNNRTSWRKISEYETEAPIIQEPTVQPTTIQPTTIQPTTIQPTTIQQTTVQPTTVQPTTIQQTTEAQVVTLGMGLLSVNNTSVIIGDTVRYTLIVNNSGNKNATGVPVTLNGMTKNINISAGGSTTVIFDVTMYAAGKIDRTASYNFEGQQATSNSVSVNVAPKKVTNLTVTGTTTNSVSLSWTAAEGATGYIVQRGNVTIASNVNGTNFTDGGLAPNTQYQYKVIAVNSNIQSQYESISATTKQEVINYTAEVVRIGGYPTSITEGDLITFTTLVKNTSGAPIPAGTSFTVNIGIDNSTVQNVSLTQAIPTDGYVKITQSWTATIGGHTLSASMAGSSVTKRINVEKKINTTYSSTSGRDLYVTDISYYNLTKNVKNGSIDAGDRIVWAAHGVNTGNQSIGSGTKIGVQYQVDGQGWPANTFSWCDNFYGPLAAGEFHEFRANGGTASGNDKNEWIATNGTHSIMAWIDDSSLIGESNENNNQTSINITVPFTVNYNSTVDAPDNVNVSADPVAIGEVSGLTVTKATTRTIALTWNAAQGATSYKVYRGNTYLGITNSTSYTDSGNFTAGQTYVYTVKSVGENQESSGVSQNAIPVDTGVQVVGYSKPQGFDTSDKYSMSVNGETVGVFKTRVSEIHSYPGNNWKSGEYSNVAIFDYDNGDAEVRIVATNRTDISSAVVKPVSDNISATCTREGNNTIISLTIPDGKQGQYDIEMNGDAGHNNTIFLFSKEIMTEPANTWKTVHSGEKLTGHVEVPDNQTLYIEGGGVIEGYVHMGHNSKLLGRGIISQKSWGAWGGSNRNNPLSVGYEPLGAGTTGGSSFGRNNVSIEGITVLDSCGWALNVRNSHDVTIKDVNIMTAASNGDGITIQSSYNIDVEGCFVRSFDDTLVVKNYDNINSHNIKFTNCVLWTDLAQSMEIGYETDMGGVSSRVESGLVNNDPRIYNVLFNDIDVIHNYHKDVMSIHNANEIPVYHIGYKDIRVEQHSGGLFANGDDYGEFHNYSYRKGSYGPWAQDVNFDNVYGYQSTWGNSTSINPNTFFN